MSIMAQSLRGPVFMSYSRKDQEVMQRIAKFLRNQGIEVWVDNEKLIPGTTIWEEKIEKAIKGAAAIVVVMSPHSKKSEWVRREISFADQYRKRIFPLLVRGDIDSSITLSLITRQFVDLRKNEDLRLHDLRMALSSYFEELMAEEAKAPRIARTKGQQDQLTRERPRKRKAEDHEAKTKTEKLAAQKAEEDQIALERAEAERKTKEEDKPDYWDLEAVPSKSSRTYQISNKFMSVLAQEISTYIVGQTFEDDQKLEAYIIPQGNDLLVQAKNVGGLVTRGKGVFMSVRVLIEPLNLGLKVSISGKSRSESLANVISNYLNLGDGWSSREHSEKLLIMNLWTVIEDKIVTYGGTRIA
jgi:hypothetical protein